MIDGLKIRFTTQELRKHLEARSAVWEKLSERILRLVEDRGADLKPEHRKRAAESVDAARKTALIFRAIAAQLPEAETFDFAVPSPGVSYIEWPGATDRSDAELLAWFRDELPRPPDFLSVLFGGGRS